MKTNLISSVRVHTYMHSHYVIFNGHEKKKTRISRKNHSRSIGMARCIGWCNKNAISARCKIYASYVSVRVERRMHVNFRVGNNIIISVGNINGPGEPCITMYNNILSVFIYIYT